MNDSSIQLFELYFLIVMIIAYFTLMILILVGFLQSLIFYIILTHLISIQYFLQNKRRKSIGNSFWTRSQKIESFSMRLKFSLFISDEKWFIIRRVLSDSGNDLITNLKPLHTLNHF